MYSKTEQNKALYIFYNREYSEPFSFNVGEPRFYLDFFNSRKFIISVFNMRENIELEYVLQEIIEKGIVHFF